MKDWEIGDKVAFRDSKGKRQIGTIVGISRQATFEQRVINDKVYKKKLSDNRAFVRIGIKIRIDCEVPFDKLEKIEEDPSYRG